MLESMKWMPWKKSSKEVAKRLVSQLILNY
jgi:hypothetical protein